MFYSAKLTVKGDRQYLIGFTEDQKSFINRYTEMRSKMHVVGSGGRTWELSDGKRTVFISFEPIKETDHLFIPLEGDARMVF